MNKKLIGIVMLASFLLLASCGPDEGVGPIDTSESIYTPTPIIVPTCTPAETPALQETPQQVQQSLLHWKQVQLFRFHCLLTAAILSVLTQEQGNTWKEYNRR